MSLIVCWMNWGPFPQSIHTNSQTDRQTHTLPTHSKWLSENYTKLQWDINKRDSLSKMFRSPHYWMCSFFMLPAFIYSVTAPTFNIITTITSFVLTINLPILISICRFRKGKKFEEKKRITHALTSLKVSEQS